MQHSLILIFKNLLLFLFSFTLQNNIINKNIINFFPQNWTPFLNKKKKLKLFFLRGRKALFFLFLHEDTKGKKKKKPWITF